MATPQGHKPPQFSVQTLLIVMTGVALLCALATVAGMAFLSLLLGLWTLMVPVALATLAAYCHGYRRTFFAASLFGWLATAYSILNSALGRSPWHYPAILTIVVPPLAAAGCGVVALVTRRFLESRGCTAPRIKNPIVARPLLLPRAYPS